MKHEISTSFAAARKARHVQDLPARSPGADLKSSVKWPLGIGFALVLVFLLVFVFWGSFFDLAGGAVAPGIISPDGSRKTVQHLEGGIIRKLLVRDGDVVKMGQPLLVLESTEARVAYDVLLTEQRTLLATQARLEAERMGQVAFDFPADLQGADPRLRTITEGQLQIFHARQALLTARKRVLNQQIEQLGEQIKGYRAQVASASRQLDLIAMEIEAKASLQRKGLIALPVLQGLQRLQAEISGRRGEYIAAIARTKLQIGETELQFLSLDSERADQIANELDKTRVEFATINERLSASRAILARTVIAAPVNGTVVNLRFKTEGGVIQHGEHVLDIVPSDEPLLIDARVSPTDIDVVHVGLSAVVHLTAFTGQNMLRMEGKVQYVSADRLADEKTGPSYYLARVAVERDELKRLGPQYKLVSGMPAEVLIVTGERTMFQYMFRPFLDAIRRSFHES